MERDVTSILILAIAGSVFAVIAVVLVAIIRISVSRARHTCVVGSRVCPTGRTEFSKRRMSWI